MATRQIAATDVTGALGYSPVRAVGMSAGMTRTGLLIPYYVYVSNPYNDSDFNSLLIQIRNNPNVPVIVVLNQSGVDGLGGPGPYDAGFAQMLRMLKSAGATCCGYVSTVNATRDPTLVKADIVSWLTLYPSAPVDGVFFDQVPYAVGTANANITLYKSYYDYAHAQGHSVVVGNPGSPQLNAWYDTRVADIYVCYENTSWPTLSSFNINPPSYISGATTDYDTNQFAMLVYNSSWSGSSFSTLAPFFRWIYATDNPSPASSGNPWAALPSYLSSLFQAAATQNAASLSGYAPLDSPPLTGTPTVPTAAVDTNTTRAASTAFVVGQAGSATPVVDGTAAVGTSLRYARQDHVHGTDTSRAPLASPTFTGSVVIPGGTVDNAAIGGSTRAAGAFTTLAANAAVSFLAPPALITGTTYTVGATDMYLIFNGSATCTVTMPTASSFSGRVLWMKTVAAFTVVSAGTNVKPRTSNTAGTAILSAAAGSWAHLISDASNWVIMAGA
jgi:Spherulation-specific family 4